MHSNNKVYRIVRTYIVPATRVLTWVILDGISFARPKSEILGVKSLSRRILLALISLWTICGRTSSWRKASPRATPMQILDRVFQLNWMLLKPPPENFQDLKTVKTIFDSRQNETKKEFVLTLLPEMSDITIKFHAKLITILNRLFTKIIN